MCCTSIFKLTFKQTLCKNFQDFSDRIRIWYKRGDTTRINYVECELFIKFGNYYSMFKIPLHFKGNDKSRIKLIKE